MRFNNGIYRSPFLSFALLPRIYRDRSAFDRIKDDGGEDDNDNGWKRLKEMYSIDHRGFPSPQFETVSQGMLVSFLTGFLVGAFSTANETQIRFIAENKATAFKSQMDARKKMQDKIFLSFLRGGWSRGWRLSFLTGSILTTLFSLEKYKGYTSFLDFTAAAAFTFGLYNFKRGPKPLISSLFLGGAFGTLVGVVFLPLSKLTGVTLKDLYEMDSQSLDVAIEKEKKSRDKNRGELFKESLPYRQGDGLSLSEAFKEEEQAKVNDSMKQ